MRLSSSIAASLLALVLLPGLGVAQHGYYPTVNKTIAQLCPTCAKTDEVEQIDQAWRWGPGVGPYTGISASSLDLLNGNLNTSYQYNRIIHTSTAAPYTFTLTYPVPPAMSALSVAFPSASGTVAVSATPPITLNSSTGDIGCATCLTSAPAESDPQVGTLTNTKWCTSDGSAVNCATDAPVLAESDPLATHPGHIETITNFWEFQKSPSITDIVGRKSTLLSSGIDFWDAALNLIELTVSPPFGADYAIGIPSASGTVAVSATAPITLSAAGAIGCATCMTAETDPIAAHKDAANTWTANQTMPYAIQAKRFNANDPRPAGLPMTSANAADQEFNGESLVGWTWHTAAPSTVDNSTYPGLFVLKNGTTAKEDFYTKASAIGVADFSVTIAVHYPYSTHADAGLGLAFLEADGDGFVVPLDITTTGPVLGGLNNTETIAAWGAVPTTYAYRTYVQSGDTAYIRVARTAGTVETFYSSDGVGWLQIDSDALGHNISIIGLWTKFTGTATTGTTLIVDWIRQATP